MCLAEEPMGRSYLPSVGLWLNASKSECCPGRTIRQRRESLVWPRQPRLASDSRSPEVPGGGTSPASLGAGRGSVRRASGPGSGAESPSSRDTGRGLKGDRPLSRHAPHVRGEPGAKPLVDDLLLGRVSYVAEQLPRCDLLKVNLRHKGL